MSLELSQWLFGACGTAIAAVLAFSWHRYAALADRFDKAREEEFQYRIGVAQTFASIALVKGFKDDVDRRFDRIEEKLDDMFRGSK